MLREELEHGVGWQGRQTYLSSLRKATPLALSLHSLSSQTRPCPVWASRPHQTWAAAAEDEVGERTWSLPSEGSGNVGSQGQRAEAEATLFSAWILQSMLKMSRWRLWRRLSVSRHLACLSVPSSGVLWRPCGPGFHSQP